jgi:hypothetical protein
MRMRGVWAGRIALPTAGTGRGDRRVRIPMAIPRTLGP